MAFLEDFDCSASPDCPVAQQPAYDSPLDTPSADIAEAKWSEQVQHDGVVVSRVQRNIRTAALRVGPYHIDTSIAIERRNLDGDHIVNLGKATPKRVR